MKQILTFLFFAIIFMACSNAQGLSGLNYQAIARNLNGTVLDNKAVQVRFTITAGNTGNIQYQETQDATTNAYGLFTAVIGKGTPISGTFSSIPWSNANQWLEVEIGLAGGALNSLGKMAFQSVPFSQMALSANPVGNAGGDLSGTFPAPTVAKIQGKDISNTAPTNGQALVYNTTTNKWEPNSSVGGGNLFTKKNNALFPTTFSNYLGINDSLPAARFVVNGHAAKDSFITELNGNNRIASIINDTIKNTFGGNVGLIANAGNSSNVNTGIYATTSKAASNSAVNLGIIIDNYYNYLSIDSGEVFGLYSDVGNGGHGSAAGITSYAYSNSNVVGIDNTVTFGNLAYGYKSLVDGNTSTGISTEVYGEVGNSTGISNAAIGFGDGDALGAKLIGASTSGSNTPQTIGSLIIADGFSNIPGNQIGVNSYVYSEGVSAETNDEFDLANPAGLFSSDGGSGQGIYAQTVGLGYNNQVWPSPVSQAVTGIAISDQNATNIGILAEAGNGSILNYCVAGHLNGSTNLGTGINAAIVGGDENYLPNTYAGYFFGNVNVDGDLTTYSSNSAIKAFKIDNPANPTQEYLMHSSVESPDMLNIYNGNITTDANGNATISLPDYFEALNKDFRYQLTVIGSFAQAMVATKVINNQFTIKTSQPNTEVSWQVTGIRHDAMANKFRIQNVVKKQGAEAGKYLYPQGYDVTDNNLAIHPKTMFGTNTNKKSIPVKSNNTAKIIAESKATLKKTKEEAAQNKEKLKTLNNKTSNQPKIKYLNQN